MKILTVCILAAGLALAAATPATAAPTSGAHVVPRAVGIRFVTRPLINRTLDIASRSGLPARRYREFYREMRGLKRIYNRLTWHDRARRYCEAAQAFFGYPRRYYYDGQYVYSYPYDACEEYFG